MVSNTQPHSLRGLMSLLQNPEEEEKKCTTSARTASVYCGSCYEDTHKGLRTSDSLSVSEASEIFRRSHKEQCI